MKKALKRWLPSPAKHAAYKFVWNPFRRFVWNQLDLACTLRSGLEVQVRSYPDWTIFSEIFVNEEYDVPIRHALDSAPRDRPLTVLDLGANVGYFAFRFADAFFRSNARGTNLQMILVEGSPAVFQELSRRINASPLKQHTKLISGLVGERSGGALVAESAVHYGNAITEKHGLGTRSVRYVDLDATTAELPQIDLLKCDIEGAEYMFLENYPDLLKKCRAAVFELHRYGRDVAECSVIMGNLGFSHRKVLREHELFTIEFFWR